jgi:hypothetical protein
MTAIVNNTPHNVSIIGTNDTHFDPKIRKWVANIGVTPIATIPSSGVVLNAKIETKEGTPINGVPCFEKTIEGCDPLPNDNNLHIVSALYASAAVKAGYDVDRILLVADPVMSEDGKTFIGCRGLAKPF